MTIFSQQVDKTNNFFDSWERKILTPPISTINIKFHVNFLDLVSNNRKQDMATIAEKVDFDAEADSQTLRDAMKGLGTDTDSIIEVLSSCDSNQRQQLRFAFAQMYGKVLMDDFKSELSGNFRKLVRAMMLPPALYDAHELRNAMKGLGTDEKCLIQILSCKSNDEIAAIKEEYTYEIKRDLQDDLQSECSGHFKRLLYSLSTGMRDESGDTSVSLAKADAADLREAGIGQIGTDESTFNRILCSQSHAQLRLVFHEYKKMTGQSIIKTIKKEFSGNLRDGLLAVAKIVINPASYFAQELQASMKGLGTDDKALIRILVSRSEIDLENVKAEFLKKYGETLANWVEDDTSGDYKKLLLKIIGGNAEVSMDWGDEEMWTSDEE